MNKCANQTFRAPERKTQLNKTVMGERTQHAEIYFKLDTLDFSVHTNGTLSILNSLYSLHFMHCSAVITVVRLRNVLIL